MAVYIEVILTIPIPIVMKLINTAYQRNCNLIIAGDFSYKNIDWKNEFAPPGQQHLLDFIETLQECYLYQHVTEPTRYRENETIYSI